MSAHNFRQLSDAELSRRDDDGLLDYIRLSRIAGQPREARRALQLLVIGNIDNVRRRVRMKVAPAQVDDITQEIMISAIGAAFVGESVGEFRSWLNTITARRIADHHRAHEGDPQTTPLQSEHERDEHTWGIEPESLEPDAAEVELRLGAGELLNRLNPVHREVALLYCYMQWPAARVVDEVNARHAPDPPLTESNVHKIGQRFRDDLRRYLRAGNTEETSAT